jgi:cobalt-zinc-cadmium efflux system outer membrane protein
MRPVVGRLCDLLTLSLLAPLLCPTALLAQTQRAVSFAEYLEAVEVHSLDLQAQQQTVAAARAGVSVAGVRPDPQFTTGIASKELSRANKPNSAIALTAGVALTIETGGKRNARIRNAQSNVAASAATVESFRDQMQTDAASAFIETCRARAVLALKQSSLAAFRDTVKANEARLKAGDIGLLELRRSRVEAERFATDVTSAAAAAEVAVLNLSGPLGERFETVFAHALPACERLVSTNAPPDIDELMRGALQTRRDVLLAQAAVDSARENTRLVHSNRWVDPIVNVGLTNTPRIPPIFDNEGATINNPAEHSLTLGLTVTVPIPLSRLQDGEVRQAESALTQAMLQLQATVLRARIDVQATHATYRAAGENVQRYRDVVLDDADRTLEGTRLSYRKGAASLLDLLEAQRTTEDVHLAYLQALADLANATVKLQLSAGGKAAL